jgi:hypothetical protein
MHDTDYRQQIRAHEVVNAELVEALDVPMTAIP